MPKKQKQQSESDDYSDDESEEAQKVQVKKPKVQRLDKMKNLKKIVINVSMTQYSVVTEAAEDLGWKVQYSTDSGDWDIFWTDYHIEPDVLIKMHLFQKINHYPGIHTLARKNLLGVNLMSMRDYFPQQYDFFPLTWMLPQQYVEFRTYFQSKPKGKTRTYIVKPQADCQGRGIFLTRKLDSIQNGKHYVVQRYMARPYLIDNLKFDLRIYILLGSVNPLRVYIYQQGLARLATEPYIEPTNSNLEKQCMHLTNYAINKKNPKFIFNNNSANMGFGHKRSLTCAYKQMEAKGVDIKQLKRKINDLVIKTIITGLPLMSHQYKCSQPQDYTGNMCFHILGFDVMLKSNAQPILIEVNHTPSFTTDTPLDFKIKKGLVKDALKIMNVNIKKKTQLYQRSVETNQTRLLTGKRNILEGKERQDLINQQQAERQVYESDKKNLGGFEVIYPCADEARMEMYQTLIEHATKQHFDQNASIRIKLAEKEAKKLARQQYKQMKKAKQQQTVPVNQSKQIIKETTSTKQTINTSNRIYKKSEMPYSQKCIPNERRKKTIDNGQNIHKQVYSAEQSYNNHHRGSKLKSQLQISESIKNNSQLVASDISPVKINSMARSSQKTPQLPNIQDSFADVVHKSNLIRMGEPDRRRYIKGSSIDKKIAQRSISGNQNRKYGMAKSTALVNQQIEPEIVSMKRQNISSLMARKKIETTEAHSKKKLSKDKIISKNQNINKILYGGFQAGYNPTLEELANNNGEYVMPKIFCLNFESEKSANDNSKFLLSKKSQSEKS